MFENRNTPSHRPNSPTTPAATAFSENPWQLVSMPSWNELIQTARTADLIPDPALRHSRNMRIQPFSDILREHAQRVCLIGTAVGASLVFLGAGLLTTSVVALRPDLVTSAACLGYIAGGALLALKSWEMVKSLHQARLEAQNGTPANKI